MDWFGQTAFTLLGTPVTWTEVIGDLTGLLCVWWVARQVIWNWPAGLANNVLFLVLFVDAKLYGDALLQVVFFVLGVFGWWQWATGRGGGADGSQLAVRRTSGREWVLLAVATAALWLAAWLWLDRSTDSPVPEVDALVLALSLAATYGQAVKLLESWWLWIAVDVVSVPLFVSRDLLPTAGLYVVFGVLCVVGLRDWQRSLAARPAPAAAVELGVGRAVAR